jgi:hypothetical protein
MEEMFISYISYEDYKGLGGTLSEDAFTILERKAQRTLDTITFDRIKHLTVIPDVVREVLVEFINRMAAREDVGDSAQVSQYSNGVETITYRNQSDSSFMKGLYQVAVDWLPDYLITRMVDFDVDEYLQ